MRLTLKGKSIFQSDLNPKKFILATKCGYAERSSSPINQSSNKAHKKTFKVYLYV